MDFNSNNLNRYRWLFHRLMSMSPHEIFHRIIEQQKRRAGKSINGWNKFTLREGNLPIIDIDYEKFRQAPEILKNEWVKIFEHSIKGRWIFLGVKWPSIIGNDIWHLDPLTKNIWPKDKYCFDIPFRHKKNIGDIKYVWELNRLQFLPPIAALARINNDKKAQNYCLDCIDSWIDANPPFLGVNWASGIEIALRSISIILTVSLLGSDKIPASLAKKIRTALNAHAFWLTRYPSLFSSANNHLIAEASALYILGVAMPDIPNAKKYRDYGYKALIAESDKQILDDGVGAEQSPTYSAFTLEYYLLCLHIGKNTDKPFPKKLYERLCLAGECLNWFSDDGGNQPRIGDDDEGRVIYSSLSHESHYVSSVLGCLSSMLERPDLTPPKYETHLRNLILGKPKENTISPSGFRIFNDGGYSVWRERVNDKNILAIMDHGPLGYLSIAAHGHADALALWLHIDDIPVFIDAGTYLYHSGGEWRDYFRSTKAHNTLTIDDKNTSTISGAFNWSQKANCKILSSKCELDNWHIEASHDGYKKSLGVTHIRRFERASKDSFIISDHLEGKLLPASSNVKRRFFVGLNCDARMNDDNSVTIYHNSKPIIIVKLDCDEEVKQQVKLSVVKVHVSEQFGKMTDGNCIEISQMSLPLCQIKIQIIK